MLYNVVFFRTNITDFVNDVLYTFTQNPSKDSKCKLGGLVRYYDI